MPTLDPIAAYYDAHARKCDPTDFQGQVLRTPFGKSVGPEMVALIVEDICAGLSLKSDDVLLDLCCGNGAITDRLFARCAGGLGADFTPYLIEVAKAHFERPPTRLFHLQEVCDFVETADLTRFTKVLCFGGCQYLPAPQRLLAALRARSSADRVLLGNLPDLERIDRFPNAIAPEDVRRNDAPLGVWRTKDEIKKLAAVGMELASGRRPTGPAAASPFMTIVSLSVTVKSLVWMLGAGNRIGDNSSMARRIRPTPPKSGLYYAREARGMSRSELVRLSGVSKQQLSRLENGQIRLRLDHLKPFANHLGYTPEQILLWGRYPGTGGGHVESSDVLREEPGQEEPLGPAPGQVPELDTRAGLGGGGMPARELRKDGRHADPLKSEGWLFPASFVREQLHTSPARLLVLDTTGDSMAPTIVSGERVIIDTSHKTPTPDGLYAIRDTFNCIVVKRLQVLRSSRPPRVKVISDNPNHPSEEAPLGEIEIVGKVLCCLKLF